MACQFIGAGVQLVQTLDLVGCARPVDEAQNMLLVSGARLVGVDLTRGKRPDVFAGSTAFLFGLSPASHQ